MEDRYAALGAVRDVARHEDQVVHLGGGQHEPLDHRQGAPIVNCGGGESAPCHRDDVIDDEHAAQELSRQFRLNPLGESGTPRAMSRLRDASFEFAQREHA